MQHHNEDRDTREDALQAARALRNKASESGQEVVAEVEEAAIARMERRLAALTGATPVVAEVQSGNRE